MTTLKKFLTKMEINKSTSEKFSPSLKTSTLFLDKLGNEHILKISSQLESEHI